MERAPEIFHTDFNVTSCQVSPLFTCAECGCSTYTESHRNLMQSAKSCGACFHIGYHNLEWCGAEGCDSSFMYHYGCMQLSLGVRMCTSCVDKGAQPAVSDRGSVGDEESGTEEDEHYWSDTQAQQYFESEHRRIWANSGVGVLEKIEALKQSVNQVAKNLSPQLLKVMVELISSIKAHAIQEASSLNGT